MLVNVCISWESEIIPIQIHLKTDIYGLLISSITVLKNSVTQCV